MYSISEISKAYRTVNGFLFSVYLSVLTQVIFRHWRFKFCVPHNSTLPFGFLILSLIRLLLIIYFLLLDFRRNPLANSCRFDVVSSIHDMMISFLVAACPTFVWAVCCWYYWCVNILSTRVCIDAIEVSFVNRIFMHKCRYRTQPSSIYTILYYTAMNDLSMLQNTRTNTNFQ